MKCLKCEKELERCPDSTGNVNDAGYMDVSFHWGSRHDMCRGFEGGKYRERRWAEEHHAPDSQEYKRSLLLTCDLVQAYICDDCFEKHLDLFEGYDKEHPLPPKEKRVI